MLGRSASTVDEDQLERVVVGGVELPQQSVLCFGNVMSQQCNGVSRWPCYLSDPEQTQWWVCSMSRLGGVGWRVAVAY